MTDRWPRWSGRRSDEELEQYDLMNHYGTALARVERFKIDESVRPWRVSVRAPERGRGEIREIGRFNSLEGAKEAAEREAT